MYTESVSPAAVLWLTPCASPSTACAPHTTGLPLHVWPAISRPPPPAARTTGLPQAGHTEGMLHGGATGKGRAAKAATESSTL